MTRGHDTDRLVLTSRILREVRESSTPFNDCLIYPFHTLEVTVRGTGMSTTIPITHAAYAMTHPHDHLTPDECVMTTCGKADCIEASHLSKQPRLHPQKAPREKRSLEGSAMNSFSRKPCDLSRLKLPSQVLDAILENTFKAGTACKLYAGLMVKLSDGTPVSVARIVYAIAHPEDPVTEQDIVVHLCEGIDPDNDDPSRLICVEPSHLAKRRVVHQHEDLRASA